jgi:hypothetical protein
LSYWIYAGKEEANFSYENWDSWIYSNEGSEIVMDQNKFDQLTLNLWVEDGDTGILN